MPVQDLPLVLIWLIPHDHIRKMRESAKLMILRTRQKPMVKFVMIQGSALGDGLPDGLPRPPSFCGAARASTTSRCLHWSLEERTQKGTWGWGRWATARCACHCRDMQECIAVRCMVSLHEAIQALHCRLHAIVYKPLAKQLLTFLTFCCKQYAGPITVNSMLDLPARSWSMSAKQLPPWYLMIDRILILLVWISMAS